MEIASLPLLGIDRKDSLSKFNKNEPPLFSKIGYEREFQLNETKIRTIEF